ncbi:MAG TPA: hypothetical protein PLI05_04425 [Methanotrichaceae archaeon]|nr:hypothetical protein [Methanotrichaceae archaeon]HQF16298.1 hypothetical protein [Methanotrichaceae archaeon]HQI90070.1 hypothetical protein [Methanotrichaceae archaeon]
MMITSSRTRDGHDHGHGRQLAVQTEWIFLAPKPAWMLPDAALSSLRAWAVSAYVRTSGIGNGQAKVHLLSRTADISSIVPTGARYGMGRHPPGLHCPKARPPGGDCQ